MRRYAWALLVVAIACKREERPPPGTATGKTQTAEQDPCAKAHPHEGGPMAWISDDLPSALACAAKRKQAVVLDLWAPWCHTCLSMQTTVFTDASFKPDADRFVFAALDTDREGNADAVARYPLSAWPTFYVIAPDGSVLARFVGGASIAQFHAFLDAGVRALAGGAAGADAKLLAAERALQQKDFAAAEGQLVAALAEAPKEWARRPDALVSLIGTKAKRKDYAGCVDLAESSLDATGNAASASDFLYTAMTCAEELAKGPASESRSAERASASGPEKIDKANGERVQKLRERAVARWQTLVDDASAPMSVDDRSDAMANLRETLDKLGKKDAAKAVAEQQRQLLDATAAKAESPMAAMTYNWPRAEVYVYLERPLDLVPALEKSAKDLPKEYDPRSRLGWIYLKAGKLPEAAKWTDEALALVYGPRKARVLAQRAEIAQKQGDKAAERRSREDIVKLWQTLPAGQQQPEALEKAKQALADMDKPPAPAEAKK
jgi:thioredoxin-like negative regulator of GroEL